METPLAEAVYRYRMLGTNSTGGYCLNTLLRHMETGLRWASEWPSRTGLPHVYNIWQVHMEMQNYETFSIPCKASFVIIFLNGLPRDVQYSWYRNKNRTRYFGGKFLQAEAKEIWFGNKYTAYCIFLRSDLIVSKGENKINPCLLCSTYS